jgi:hypothetical protein
MWQGGRFLGGALEVILTRISLWELSHRLVNRMLNVVKGRFLR